MKKFFRLTPLILLASCGMSTKEASFTESSGKNTIVYTLTRQEEVERLLSEQIRKQGENVYFYLSSNNDGYTIFLDKIDKGNENPYAIRTNRKLFIDKKYYPLVLDFDTVFGVTENADEVSNKYSASASPVLNKFDSNYHGDYYVSFNRRGDVISCGFDGLVRY